jgi:transposase InsO family protein
MARCHRTPAEGLIPHSDRRSQYACYPYQGLLAEYGIHRATSRKGDCLDNAVAERFFGSIEGKALSLQHCARHQGAWDDVIDYIEISYDCKRLHSYLGYISPNTLKRLARVP